MNRQQSLFFGSSAFIGAILTVLSNVPPAVYGVQPTDAYIFDPAVLSPLWISRTVIPFLSIVGALGLVVGLVGLVYRDWGRSGRWRRFGGAIATAGLFLVTIPIIVMAINSEAPDPSGVLSLLAAVAIGALGVVLFVPGTLALGYWYYREGASGLGVGLISVIVATPILGFLAPSEFGSLLSSLPVAVTWGFIASEFLTAAESAELPNAGTEDAESDRHSKSESE